MRSHATISIWAFIQNGGKTGRLGQLASTNVARWQPITATGAEASCHQALRVN